MADNPQRERDMKLPVVEVGGRFYTKYNPQIALDIVERIADGELLINITAKAAQPQTITKQTFLRWVATVPELQQAYAAAVRISAQAFEEKAIQRAERVADAPGSPQNVSAASLLISQYRWSAGRRDPKYSDKGNTTVVVPVNINTTLDMGKTNQTVDVEVPDIYTIKFEEGKFEEVKDRVSPSPSPSISEPRKEQTNHERFRELLKPDRPVIGTQSQPIIRRTGEGMGVKGPRKRVLKPRGKK